MKLIKFLFGFCVCLFFMLMFVLLMNSVYALDKPLICETFGWNTTQTEGYLKSLSDKVGLRMSNKEYDSHDFHNKINKDRIGAFILDYIEKVK